MSGKGRYLAETRNHLRLKRLIEGSRVLPTIRKFGTTLLFIISAKRNRTQGALKEAFVQKLSLVCLWALSRLFFLELFNGDVMVACFQHEAV